MIGLNILYDYQILSRLYGATGEPFPVPKEHASHLTLVSTNTC